MLKLALSLAVRLLRWLCEPSRLARLEVAAANNQNKIDDVAVKALRAAAPYIRGLGK